MATKTEAGLSIGLAVATGLASYYFAAQNILRSPGTVDLTSTTQPRLGEMVPPPTGTPLAKDSPVALRFQGGEFSSNGFAWPDSAEKIADMCGGDASQWQRNPE